MKYYCQRANNDCGIACLKMILSQIDSNNDKLLCKLDQLSIPNEGLNIKHFTEIANKNGLSAYPLIIQKKHNLATSNIPLPFIAHCRNMYNDHYVLVNRITQNDILLWDPDRKNQKHWISLEEFLNSWTGCIIICEFNSAATNNP